MKANFRLPSFSFNTLYDELRNSTCGQDMEGIRKQSSYVILLFGLHQNWWFSVFVLGRGSSTDDELWYRAVHKKCPGERHIVEPRGFFYLKEQIF